MQYFDLKQENLEEKLIEYNFEENEIARIQEDIGYFDHYFLVQEGDNIGFVTSACQPISDPYLKFKVEEIDLLNYRGCISTDTFLDVLDNIFKIPQLVRCVESEKNTLLARGFEIPEETMKDASRLIPITFRLDPNRKFTVDENIRLMQELDLEEIEKQFYEEYRARHTAVKRMYKADPNSCIVYEGGAILGVCFAEKLAGEKILYVHQIWVKEDARRFRIDKKILASTACIAMSKGLTTIKATIRGNLFDYYERFGAKEDVLRESHQYLMRYSI